MTDIEKVYTDYFDTVYRYVLGLSRDGCVADEITQETFFKALKNLNTFKGQCKLSVWLCQIAKNCPADSSDPSRPCRAVQGSIFFAHLR